MSLYFKPQPEERIELPKQLKPPRRCSLTKWPGVFDGYGFKLYAANGHFVGDVDENSPAMFGGLVKDQRVLEVNGINVRIENHMQLVERIRMSGDSVELFVVDKRTWEWLQRHHPHAAITSLSAGVPIEVYETPDEPPPGLDLPPKRPAVSVAAAVRVPQVK